MGEFAKRPVRRGSKNQDGLRTLWFLDFGYSSTLPPPSSNLRIKKQFTDLDKDRFRHEGFEYIARFFENSLEELAPRNPDLQQSFRRIEANRFTAAAYRNGEKVCRGSASLGGSSMGSESIEYSMTDAPRHGGMNEAVMVRADDETIYFEALGMQLYGNSKSYELHDERGLIPHRKACAVLSSHRRFEQPKTEFVLASFPSSPRRRTLSLLRCAK